MFTHTVSKKMMLLVFAFFYLINVIASGGHIDRYDGIETFLTTESMALKHTAKVDPTVPSVESLHFNVNYTVAYFKYTVEKKPFDQNIPLEPVYTVRSLLISAVALPFYELALVLSLSPLVLVSMLTNSLLIALTSLVIFCFAVELYRSAKIGFALSLMFNVCSFVLPYVTTLWTQPLQALTLVASLFFIYKSLHHNPFFICSYLGASRKPKKATSFGAPKKAAGGQGIIGGQVTAIDAAGHHVSHNHRRIRNRGFYYAGTGGLLLGLSVFAHATSLVILPGFLVYAFVEMRKKNMGNFFFLVAVLLVVLFAAGVVNYARFDSFTEFGYGYYGSMAAHNGWKGLVGLLVSPGAGLFLYFPLSILIPWAAKRMVDQNMKRLLYLFVFIIVINWLDVGTLSFKEPTSWWGEGWGPRYLVVLLPFITLMVGSLLVGIGKRAVLRYSVIALSAAGFCITMLGVLFWSYYDLVYMFLKEKIEYGLIWNKMAWDPVYSPIVLHAKALHENYAASIPVDFYFHTSWHWVNFGLAPCQIDNYIYCTYGIVMVAPLLALAGAVMAVVLWQIKVLKRRNRITAAIRRVLA
jgi:hypothetical protein